MYKSDSNFFLTTLQQSFSTYTLKTPQMVHTTIDGAIFNDVLPIHFVVDSNVAP